jgi:murein DD-endopeptidase MepM/ murein hydrolase activator NlpD
MSRNLSSVTTHYTNVVIQIKERSKINALIHVSHVVKHHTRAHQSLIALTLFVLLNNVIAVAAAHNTPDVSQFVVSDPYQIADTVRLLSDYTPGIEENPDEIAYTLEERVNGNFLSQQALIATQAGVTDDPTTPDPPAAPENDQRTKETKYVVRIGDTLSGIGEAFSLKIATIKIKNNLSDADNLKPGQELTLPAQDLSDKALKAAENRKIASAALKENPKGKRIVAGKPSGGYGLMIPIHHNGISRGIQYGHDGIDYRANVGTPVMAAANGVVVSTSKGGWNGGFGKNILIAHNSGMTTRYAHLSDVEVSPGQNVSQGQIIAASGNTGRSTGPHLHFELRINGGVRNPF